MELKIEKTEKIITKNNYRQMALAVINQVKPGENTFIEKPDAVKVQNAIGVYKSKNGIKEKMFTTRSEGNGIRFYRLSLLILLTTSLLSSCSSGRLVPQNKYHFDKRERNREVRDSIRAGQDTAYFNRRHG